MRFKNFVVNFDNKKIKVFYTFCISFKTKNDKILIYDEI